METEGEREGGRHRLRESGRGCDGTGWMRRARSLAAVVSFNKRFPSVCVCVCEKSADHFWRDTQTERETK